MAQEGMKNVLDLELVEPSKQSFELVEELLELEAQNSIYTNQQDTTTAKRSSSFRRSSLLLLAAGIKITLPFCY